MKLEYKFKRNLILGGVVAMLVISSFIYMPVIADSHDDDEDDDGIDDELEHENEREIETEISANEVKIESSLKLGEVHNEIEFSMKTGDEGLELEIEFSKDNDTIEREIEFEVKITEIVEYRDLDSNGIYENSNDEDIQTLKLDDYNPILYSFETIDNESVHIFSVQTTDGVFSATMYATGEFAIINDVLVAPTQVKVDLGIHNFNYTESDTALALKVKLESEVEVEYEEDEETEDETEGHAINESEVEVLLGDYSGFFSWIETALVDGVEYEVKKTPLEIDVEETKLYLNYPRGNEIIHDPKVGMANILQLGNTGLVGDNNLIFIAVAALLVTTSLGLAFRKKFKR